MASTVEWRQIHKLPKAIQLLRIVQVKDNGSLNHQTCLSIASTTWQKLWVKSQTRYQCSPPTEWSLWFKVNFLFVLTLPSWHSDVAMRIVFIQSTWFVRCPKCVEKFAVVGRQINSFLLCWMWPLTLGVLIVLPVGLILLPVLRRYFLKGPFANIPGPPSSSIITGDFDISPLYMPWLILL